MKILSSILCSIIILTLVTSCGDKVKAEINLNTIQCGMCVNKIKNSLNDLDGIVKVDADIHRSNTFSIIGIK